MLAPVPAHRGPPVRMVALGDSVSVGIGDRVGPDGTLGWAEHLAWTLGVGHLVNLARTGARARDVRRHQLGPALAADADLATVLVGGNDVLRGDFDPAAVARDVRECVQALLGAGVTVLVVLLHDPRPALPGPRVVGEVLAERISAVNLHLRRALADLPAHVLHTWGHGWAADRATWSADRMHPGPAGHRRLARIAAEQLRSAGLAVLRPLAEPLPDPHPLVARLRIVSWVVREGVPWLARRSRDLLPELAWLLLRETIALRRRSARGARLTAGTPLALTSGTSPDLLATLARMSLPSPRPFT